MNGYGSLLERLSGEASERDRGTAESCVLASVAAHLSRMLNTRAGSVQTLPDYGLPDFNDMRLSLHDSLSQTRRLIEHFIEAYEPRLGRVRVTALPQGHDPLCLAFSIEGVLEVGEHKRRVSFAARLDGRGQVQVN